MAISSVVERVPAPVARERTSRKPGRDYRAEHQRRTERARAAGYRSYREMRDALWEPQGRSREYSRRWSQRVADPGPSQGALW